MLINFVKEHPDAKLPTYADKGCTGADLYSAENVLLPGLYENVTVLSEGVYKRVSACPVLYKINTGLSIASIHFPYFKDCDGDVDENHLNQLDIQIRMRSGLASKGLMLLNGVGTIDHTYRGPILILVANFGRNDLQINKGDRIAQLVCNIRYPQSEMTFKFVPKGEQENTERGVGAFGSTGQ